MIAIELTKQVRRPRGLVTLAVMATLAALLTLVIGVSRARIAERIGDWGSVVSSTSGLTMPLIALSAMLLFLLPLAVAIFAGERSPARRRGAACATSSPVPSPAGGCSARRPRSPPRSQSPPS